MDGSFGYILILGIRKSYYLYSWCYCYLLPANNYVFILATIDVRHRHAIGRGRKGSLQTQKETRLFGWRFLRELRKYTLGDRAGTEEFNDDRIASECSQRVHLNIPQV